MSQEPFILFYFISRDERTALGVSFDLPTGVRDF